MKRLVLISASMLFASAAFAQSDSKIPPENGKNISEIIAQIEVRPDFRYLENVEWSRDGYYEITYHTADKAKVEIKIDAASGQPRD